MSKQTSRQFKKVEQHSVIHPVVERVGAVALTALSILVSFEAIIEHQSKGSHPQSGDNRPSISEIFARNESKSGETARLPEEFDIGLQTPHVSGL